MIYLLINKSPVQRQYAKGREFLQKFSILTSWMFRYSFGNYMSIYIHIFSTLLEIYIHMYIHIFLLLFRGGGGKIKASCSLFMRLPSYGVSVWTVKKMFGWVWHWSSAHTLIIKVSSQNKVGGPYNSLDVYSIFFYSVYADG